MELYSSTRKNNTSTEEHPAPHSQLSSVETHLVFAEHICGSSANFD